MLIVILRYSHYKMIVSKTEHYTADQQFIAHIAKALGHPARIAIIEHLLSINACICKDIIKELPLAQATVSQHLKVLLNAKLIKGTIEGNTICYCINEKTFKVISDYFSKNLFTISTQKCC